MFSNQVQTNKPNNKLKLFQLHTKYPHVSSQRCTLRKTTTSPCMFSPLEKYLTHKLPEWIGEYFRDGLVSVFYFQPWYLLFFLFHLFHLFHLWPPPHQPWWLSSRSPLVRLRDFPPRPKSVALSGLARVEDFICMSAEWLSSKLPPTRAKTCPRLEST